MSEKQQAGSTPKVETLRTGVNLSTPHAPEKYPGLTVVRPGPGWDECVICTEPGQTVVALGGERAPGYATPYGGAAQDLALRPGDRATLVRSGLPHRLGEWRIERRS